MSLALGVDGGGTQTRCIVIDHHATIVGFGTSGPSKPDAVEATIGSANLREAITSACDAIGGAGKVESVFIGMGGVISQADIDVVMHMLAGVGFQPGIPIGVDHDVRVALAGGTAGEPGIALIVGTGSSCYGRNAAGDSWRSGGWGYAIDDFGSGFYLGQQALTAVVKAFDGRGSATALTNPILSALGISDHMQLMHRIYHPRLDHTGIAALAPTVVQVAEHDAVARAIIDTGCEELARMVEATARYLRLPTDAPVVPVGSLARQSIFFRERLDSAIHSRLPDARIMNPMVSGVVGAAFLALEQLGITLPAASLAQMPAIG